MASSGQSHFVQQPNGPQSSDRIRQLNDQFRNCLIGGQVMITSGIEALGLMALTEIMDKVRNFETFQPSSDPHDEHDFGSFEYQGETIFWKIDYYACDILQGSSDPSDASVTRRVLTVMLGHEY